MRRARSGFHSPVVRRLLEEQGLDASTIEGTGAGGRITRDDVQAAVAARTASEPPPPVPIRTDAPSRLAVAPEPVPESEALPPSTPEPEPALPVSSPPTVATERETLVPFSAMRRRIAGNLRESITTAAHAFCAVETDFERVDRVRRVHGAAWREREGFSLTYLPFVARAVVDALAEFPHVNASVVDDGLLVRHDVHLGFAVDLDHAGLIVPVVHDAGRRPLVDIARAVADLAERARSNRLQPDEVAGGTFTITNPGPSGTLISVPIINQPQVGILATDTVRRRPVMIPTGDGGEGIAIHPVGMLGLSFDHRAIDGAYAASFVSRVKELLETRDWDPEVTADQ
ncbi:MAG: 2-oxo acid dehydrogenase subunit E2 [Acidimicrobiia bacterium]|nr:2-oxo acid dehydrogenase subunit E2 [Acidimicrobiia bacterium]